MVIYLERSADLHTAQLIPLPLTVSSFSKIQIGFTILVPAHPGSPGQRAVKRVCVCVWYVPPNYGTHAAEHRWKKLSLAADAWVKGHRELCANCAYIILCQSHVSWHTSERHSHNTQTTKYCKTTTTLSQQAASMQWCMQCSLATWYTKTSHYLLPVKAALRGNDADWLAVISSSVKCRSTRLARNRHGEWHGLLPNINANW